MRPSTLLAAIAATLPLPALADFDMWESQATFPGPWDTSVTIQEVKVTEPYINYDKAICQSHTLVWNDIGTLWCNHKIRFNNGCAVIKNCANKGNVHNLASGTKFGDLEDCGGGKRGECFAWHGGATAKSCTGREGRISYSRVACKTSFFNGAEAVGEW